MSLLHSQHSCSLTYKAHPCKQMYESGSRNPKPDQLLKIANAPGVFKHPEIDSRLAKFAKAKKLQENLIASKDAFPSEEAFQHEAEQMNKTCEQIKQHLVDTNRVVKKGTSGISGKMYNPN